MGGGAGLVGRRGLGYLHAMGMISHLHRISSEQLGALQASEEALPEVVYAEEREQLDLDKAWHGLHYLFTGSDFEAEGPLAFLVDGGELVGDLGMGPVRAFTPEATADISRAIEALDEAGLRRRFDPEEMTELDIYPPDIWTRDPEEDDSLGYLLAHFEQLKPFLRETVQRGLGLLVYLS